MFDLFYGCYVDLNLHFHCPVVILASHFPRLTKLHETEIETSLKMKRSRTHKTEKREELPVSSLTQAVRSALVFSWNLMIVKKNTGLH